jgi:anion-transporting  ArsA/GET3 family ATPase
MGRPFADLVRQPSRFLFFTGKGGVGKTSLACATAVALADAGKPFLLVSTDPASNLDEVLGQKLTNRPTSIPGVPRLSALNIDPEEAARAYREKLDGHQPELRAFGDRRPSLGGAWAGRSPLHQGGCRGPVTPNGAGSLDEG